MAHKKGQGSTATAARQQLPAACGTKVYGGEKVNAGQILVRQVGYRDPPGPRRGNRPRLHPVRPARRGRALLRQPQPEARFGGAIQGSSPPRPPAARMSAAMSAPDFIDRVPHLRPQRRRRPRLLLVPAREVRAARRTGRRERRPRRLGPRRDRRPPACATLLDTRHRKFYRAARWRPRLGCAQGRQVGRGRRGPPAASARWRRTTRPARCLVELIEDGQSWLAVEGRARRARQRRCSRPRPTRAPLTVEPGPARARALAAARAQGAGRRRADRLSERGQVDLHLACSPPRGRRSRATRSPTLQPHLGMVEHSGARSW